MSVHLSVRPRFVHPDEYLQHQWIFFPDTLHMHLLQSSNESCEVLSGSNWQWPTYCHFCLLKLTKCLKILSVRMTMMTNEHFFPILCTCINYNPPMYPVKLRPDQIQNGRLITIFVCSNWQNIWKLCPSGWISPTPMNIFFLIIYTCIYYNPPMYPVELRPDQIQNGQLITIFVCSNWQNIWKLCSSG